MKEISTDVVVVGGGAAGLRAAVAARDAGAKVLVVDQGHPGYSGSSFYFLNRRWGYQVVLPDDPPPARDDLVREVLDVGGPSVDERKAEILVDESWPRLEELLRWGARLVSEEGRPQRVRGCFGKNRSGVAVENHRPVFRAIAKSLHTLGHWTAEHPILEEGRCAGILGRTREGEIEAVHAKSVVLTTGGAAGLFRKSLGDPRCVGAGYALGLRAGAELRGLEFIQLIPALAGRRFPVFFPCPQLNRGEMRPSSALARELRRLVRDGSAVADVLAERSRHFPFSARHNSLYFDWAVANMGEAEMVQGQRLDDSVSVFHAAHAFNGGVVIDEWGRTTVEGLFAAGEVAGGVHGADRLGGTMIPSCLVFGARAGMSAAEFASRMTREPVRIGALEGSDHVSTSAGIGAAWRDLRDTISRSLGVVRSEAALAHSLERLREIETRLAGAVRGTSLGAAMVAARTMMESARLRRESVGPHFRVDEDSRVQNVRQ